MPELPETETIARDLDREIRGRTIVGVAVRAPTCCARPTPTRSRAARGRGGAGAWRRAKLVVLDLSTGDRLVVQPRFTGALLLDRGALAEAERRFSTLALTLDDGTRVHYRDIRRSGR
jgi:formamidopyrimidine-DNA glycosylase